MGSLLNYSAVSAKVSAMRSRLLTDEQFRELAFQPDVPSAVEYLKGFSAYRDLFEGLQADDLHRGNIEKLLNLSLYRDFSSLYRFSGVKQRRFLDLYFMHFEIDVLKKCLRNVMSRKASDLDLSIFEDFFRRHSGLDLAGLSGASGLSEFIVQLEGSCFHAPVKALSESGAVSLSDYESALDSFYFARLWKNLEHDLKPPEREIIKKCIGEKIDLLNLEWICRAKQNYRLPADVLRSFLIPVHYRIREDELNRLAGASGPEELDRILKSTRYRRMLSGTEQDPGSVSGTKLFYRSLLDTVYRSSGRKNPYSAAVFNTYFYFKEEEIRKIITAIEGIRYQLGGNEIVSCLTERRQKGGAHRD